MRKKTERSQEMNKYLLLLSLSLISAPSYGQITAPTPENHLPTVSAPTPSEGIASKASEDKRFHTSARAEKELKDNKIYFFAHAMCTACKDAFIYLDTYHRDLNIPITDMKYHENLELYKQCVKKFNINNNDLHLPLICMGNHYIMGWDKERDGARFDAYLEKFEKAKLSAEQTAISDAVDERVGKDAPKPKNMLSASGKLSSTPQDEATQSVAESLEKLKGSEPIEPTAIVRDED